MAVRVWRERYPALWRWLFWVMVAVLVVADAVLLVSVAIAGHVPYDWNAYIEAGHRIGTGTLYDWQGAYSFRYAPLSALLFSWIAPMGALLWRVLHLVAAAAMPSRTLAILVLLSYPFWFDVDTGNLMVFVLLAAAWALRGNRVGEGAFLALTILIPRPLMLPMAAWIVWRRPEWRLPLVGMVAVVLVSALLMGELLPWLDALRRSSADYGSDFNLSPSRFIGLWWLVAGVPLAIWLTVRERIGLASLAISPYLLPYYWLMAGLELVRPASREARRL